MQVLLFLAAGDSQAHLSSRQSSHPCSRRAAEFRSVQRLGQFPCSAASVPTSRNNWSFCFPGYPGLENQCFHSGSHHPQLGKPYLPLPFLSTNVSVLIHTKVICVKAITTSLGHGIWWRTHTEPMELYGESTTLTFTSVQMLLCQGCFLQVIFTLFEKVTMPHKLCFGDTSQCTSVPDENRSVIKKDSYKHQPCLKPFR